MQNHYTGKAFLVPQPKERFKGPLWDDSGIIFSNFSWEECNESKLIYSPAKINSTKSLNYSNWSLLAPIRAGHWGENKVLIPVGRGDEKQVKRTDLIARLNLVHNWGLIYKDVHWLMLNVATISKMFLRSSYKRPFAQKMS